MEASYCGEGKTDLYELVGPPTAACVPPGQCAITADWSQATLVERVTITHDSILLTFELPDKGKPLGLSTCACILAKVDIQNPSEGQPTEQVIRPYTPVSTNAMVGQFQLLVKVYPGGKLSGHMRSMSMGEAIEFKHIEKNVKIQYPFGKKQITMIAGGTGITPIVQALHAILGTAGDTTQVTLILGNKTQQDILGGRLLEAWEAKSGGRLKVVHILSQAEDDASWTGLKGFVDKQVLAEHAAPPSDGMLIMVCGPPPMYNALCGARDAAELTGTLADMGYKAEQVFKF